MFRVWRASGAPNRRCCNIHASFEWCIACFTQENAVVTPDNTYYSVEITNMETQKLVCINVGYTYSLDLQVSIEIDLAHHDEGLAAAVVRPAKSQRSSTRGGPRASTSMASSSPSTPSDSASTTRSGNPNARGSARPTQYVRMTRRSTTTGALPSQTKSVPYTFEPNTLYQVCVKTGRRCTVNGKQAKWRNLFSKSTQVRGHATLQLCCFAFIRSADLLHFGALLATSQPISFRTPRFLDYTINAVLPKLRTPAERKGAKSKHTSSSLAVFQNHQFRKPPKHLVTTWSYLIQYICATEYVGRRYCANFVCAPRSVLTTSLIRARFATKYEKLCQYKISDVAILLWVRDCQARL